MSTTIPVGKKPAAEVFYAVADAISRADIDQTDREALAESVAEAFATTRLGPHFNRATWTLVASDPLCACAGYDDLDGNHVPCPEGREIRVAMHLSDAPDGRSAAWKPRKPEMRCVTCGAIQYMPGYRENVLAKEAS